VAAPLPLLPVYGTGNSQRRGPHAQSDGGDSGSKGEDDDDTVALPGALVANYCDVGSYLAMLRRVVSGWGPEEARSEPAPLAECRSPDQGRAATPLPSGMRACACALQRTPTEGAPSSPPTVGP
jgi:hypothetical protein